MPTIERIKTEKQLTSKEHDHLIKFCNSVCAIKSTESKNTTLPIKLDDQNIAIVIQESTFCFTGESSRYSRKEFAKIVEMYGGIAHNSVTAKLNYLVVCDVKNPAWAFEMYGRKVEKAMQMKNKGLGIEVVFEEDVFDVLFGFGFLHP